MTAAAYPAQVEEDGGEFILTMRDLPSFISRGATRRIAIREAPRILQRVLAGYATAGQEPPAPTKAMAGDVLIGPAGLSGRPPEADPIPYEPGRHVMVEPK